MVIFHCYVSLPEGICFVYICTEEMIELTCIRFQRQTHVELKLFHVVPRSLALCTNSSCAKAPPNSLFGSERDGL